MRWHWRLQMVAVVVLLIASGPGLAGVTLAQDATPVATPAAIAPYTPEADPSQLSGQVVLDGSSTVWPTAVDVAERWADFAPNVAVDVEISGTGGGFERFCAAETDIQNASRPITTEEAAACAAAGVTYHEFALARDGITVVVHPANDFVDCLTVEQLAELWRPDSTIVAWSDLDSTWPNEPIDLYGPGGDSGTFDFFTEAIIGEVGAARTDYVPSENDLFLVEGIAGDVHALGYFGYAYYAETQERLKAVAIDNGTGCVAPTLETIADGSYAPLSRPLFIYVSDAGLERPEVREFVRFFLAVAREAVTEVGYLPLHEGEYAANQARLEAALGE